MQNLARKTSIGFIQLILGLGFLLFFPAWTINFWQAWAYLFVFGGAIALIFGYLYKNDPKLLERRLHRAEKENSQKWIQFYIFIAYISIFILPSYDHRFSWSDVPFSIVLVGEFLVALGYFIVFIALKENTFAAATIVVTRDHKVISTGPYSIIRHPMYLGGIILLLGTPLALGSWWGLLILIPITIAIRWRLIEEELFLSKDLPGYKEYCQKIPYRLIPLIW